MLILFAYFYNSKVRSLKRFIKKKSGIRDINSWSPRMREPMVKMYGLTEFERMWHDWVDIFSEMDTQKDGSIDLYKNVCIFNSTLLLKYKVFVII